MTLRYLNRLINNTDIILTDSFPEDFEENNPFTVDAEIISNSGREVIINPCPPFKRNIEITDDVLKSRNFIGYEFKMNLVYVQKGIIEIGIGG